MNGKKAKALRREAKAATEGQPAQAYLSKQFQKVKDVKVLDEKTQKPVKQKVRITTTSIKLDPASTKGAYRLLKKGRI